MKLLDKLKSTFFEEEYVEVEEKPKKFVEHPVKAIKPQHQQPKREESYEEEIKKAPKKEVKDDYKEPIKEEIKEETPSFREDDLITKNKSFNYFDEDDFIDYDEYKNENKTFHGKYDETRKPYEGDIYGTKKIVTETPSPYAKDTKPLFKPTPIISPIYGVLDKNYKKEEIVREKEAKPTSSYVSRKNADLDSVREKAFGTTLAPEFNLKEEKEEPTIVEVEESIDDNLLYDMTDVDKTPSVDKVTLQDAEEYFKDLGLEYNIDYKDAKHEASTGRRINKTPVIDEFDDEEITPPIEEIEKPKKHDEASLEDNLFDLIDSMYEEKE